MDDYIKLIEKAEKYGIKVFVGELHGKNNSAYLANSTDKVILLKEQKTFKKLNSELSKLLNQII